MKRKKVRKVDRKLKMKVITKLLDAGFDDEKKVMNFGMKDMLLCEVRGEEIGAVIELQEAVRTHKVISFLADEKEESEETEEAESGKTVTEEALDEAEDKDDRSSEVYEGGKYYG
ncbi:MAG: hypothetical protein Q4C46_07155 [Bacillota bacterium]|nr:hypothetical protein [Bacillota bacterium]